MKDDTIRTAEQSRILTVQWRRTRVLRDIDEAAMAGNFSLHVPRRLVDDALKAELREAGYLVELDQAISGMYWVTWNS